MTEQYLERSVRSICVVALAACKAAAPVAPARPSGPPYAPLFQLDRAWSLPAEIETGHKAGRAYAVEHTARGVLNCKTGSVRTIGEATVARLACDPPLADVLAAGTWVSTSAGLFHPALTIEEPDDLSNLGDEDLMIAAAPAERHRARAVAKVNEAIDAFEFGGGWCVHDSASAEGARRDFTLCFDGAGVTGGDDLVIIGAGWRRSRFGRFPPVPGDPIGE